ncbi:hypothetical protein ICN48_05530 [Polynucleobacter sp. JS-Safj-400b-B2]|uniref:hypothetical protein n=1 Tax=Polynucleobacter sp. JS-Safj-400b-B2 TaxID=2576921 RepID=UPI001C0B5FB1|nr:hypothetical protein [Polynucleobacter sp. JS-Safj-400b-B2]MBU3625695.1 hypothetical protein [Polynucleobacter sp. JS-Safj-400b-B2]
MTTFTREDRIIAQASDMSAHITNAKRILDQAMAIINSDPINVDWKAVEDKLMDADVETSQIWNIYDRMKNDSN